MLRVGIFICLFGYIQSFDVRNVGSQTADLIFLGETVNSRFYKSIEEVDFWWAEAECGRLSGFDDGFGAIIEESVKYHFLVDALEASSNGTVETFWVGGIVRDNATEPDCHEDTLMYCFYWWPCLKDGLGSYINWETPRMSSSRFSELSNMYLIQKKGKGITFDFDDTTSLKKYICEVPKTDKTPNCTE